MHQRKGKKILIYFFLLLLVGSINNIGLSNLKFKEIDNINIVGLNDYENIILSQKIKDLNLGNIFLINKKEIMNLINQNTLVEKYNISKKYPSSLDINIQKTKFLARINNNGKVFLVGSNGKLSKNDFSNIELPFIFGKPDINEFLNFKKIIDHSKFSYNEIKNLYFFPSKRWDLELRNNRIIKLSQNFSKETLELVLEFLHDNDFKDNKIVDARIKNQIILND
ncbi:FtsQ-type POTRA domain-containing protein [Candidatus Pelagibacter sp.]|nr:FtsQ-type POTRA domain-containing protein [Candidatus Pelagibacter sp.]